MELTFHPEACAPASGNQKGAVENLVKFVTSTFIMGRSFHDDADLAQQGTEWLTHVNTQRIGDATGQLPVVVLTQEPSHVGKLPEVARDYGFYDGVIVSREGLVATRTNRYSVPAHLIGQPLTARIHATHIQVFHNDELVASHPRSREQHARIITPAHAGRSIQEQTAWAGDGLPRLVVGSVPAGPPLHPYHLPQTSW